VRCVLILLSIPLLVGCATTGPAEKQHSGLIWLPSEEQWAAAPARGLLLRRPDKSMVIVSARHARYVPAVRAALEQASGLRADIGIVETDTPNAFAFIHNGRPVVAFSASMLGVLADSPDGLATTLGHELAHLKLGHSGAASRDREAAATWGGQAVGLLLNMAGVPLGGALGVYGATAVARAYSREEEAAADELGTRWAAKAGFDACGAARVAQLIAIATNSSGGGFFATHPGYEERATAASKFAGRAC
jgi:predicted Zn-dependent protease